MVEELRGYLDEKVKPKYGMLEELGPVQISGGPGGGKAIGFYLVGDDLSALGQYMAEILPQMRQIE